MTLNEVRALDKDFLIPREVAKVLGCDQYAINVKARNGTLPFRYIMIGSRVKVPREAFIAWMEGREDKVAQPGSEN